MYAGVQYGYLCHCGDEYGKYGEAGEHECNSACLGDEGKKCGGFWRNSVYTSGMTHAVYGDEALLALVTGHANGSCLPRLAFISELKK